MISPAVLGLTRQKKKKKKKIDLRRLNKHVALQNCSIYCTWKIIRKQ